MIYEFEDFQMNVPAWELSRGGVVQKVEPRVFDVLALLLENKSRVVSRSELIDQAWQGRAISDAALSGCIKNVRKALGDDGRAQRLIKTIHGHGFRFIGEIKSSAKISPVSSMPGAIDVAATGEKSAVSALCLEEGRPTVLVLPFESSGVPISLPGLPGGIAQDIILGLSRMRWLRIIARQSAFLFSMQNLDRNQMINKTGANYFLTGTIECHDQAVDLTVELICLIDGSLVWADRLHGSLNEVHQLRADVVSNVVAMLELQISAREATLARMKAPDNLDAWSTCHLGVEGMYRFTRKDNSAAIDFFKRAIKLEPKFARAHAGLSFALFQNAFNRYDGVDIAASADAVRASAERAVELDPLDPFANFVMGRSCWLDGDPQDCLPWVERAVAINPNYAHGHYVKGFAALMSSQTENVQDEAATAISISPLDPFLYGFYGLHALSYIASGNYHEAHVWANKAARQPNAVPVVNLIALAASTMAGAQSDALHWASIVRKRMPSVDKTYFFRVLPFQGGKIHDRVQLALGEYGL